MRQKGRPKLREPQVSPSDQTVEGRNRPFHSIAISLVLLSTITYLVLQLSHLTYYHNNKETFFYDQNIPLMVTPDAYYYLRLTSDLLRGHYNNIDEKRPNSERPRPVPLITSVTAAIHQISGVAIEHIAFYLPPVLGSLMVVIYLLWGVASSGPVVALIASLAGVSSYYWSIRTGLGRFDTDCLNPVFFYLIIFCVYRFVTIRNPRRLIPLFAALFLCYPFSLWWPPGGDLGLSVIAFTYSTSFFMASSKGERLLKIGLLIMASILSLSVILAAMGALPPSLTRILGPAAEYVELVDSSNTVFPNVGQSITELRSLSLIQLMVKVSGSTIPFLFSLIGLCFLVKRKKEVAIFLLPGFIFGLASFLSERFLIFFIPVYALGIGYLLGEVLLKNKYLQAIHRPFVRWGLWFLVILGLLFPGFHLSFSSEQKSNQTAYDVRLARAIAEVSGPEGVVWAWWDYGYFLQYITGKKTIIDGGSQSPQRTFITAYPMACENALLSSNWIRFFTAHDVDDLGILMSHLGDLPKVISFLVEVLGNPTECDRILGKHGLDDLSFWRQYLFPKAEAFLFLNYATLDRSFWWYFFGTWDFEQRQGTRPRLFKMFDGDFLISDKKGVLIDRDYLFKADRLITVGSSGGDVFEVRRREFKAQDHSDRNVSMGMASGKKTIYEPGTVLVYNKSSTLAYLFDGKLFQSLVCRLFFELPNNTEQFRSLAFFPAAGGVWRVE
jgi:asparagine N-glycosylation enzyme membrane subunit Stt3